MRSIGVRELRQNASVWLRRVQAGESFTITDRGRAIATLSPTEVDPWQQLIDTGQVRPGIGDVQAIEYAAVRTGPSLSELLRADRDENE